MAKIPERFAWAAELLGIIPSDIVLEIGCGTGILAELVARQLKTGRFIAIDQSETQIVKASQRNKAFVENGVATFIACPFLAYQLPQKFDKIFAFNVNIFTLGLDKELSKLKLMLEEEGKLFVFYQFPFEITMEAANPIKENLVINGFEVIEVHHKKLHPTSAICVIARKGQ